MSSDETQNFTATNTTTTTTTTTTTNDTTNESNSSSTDAEITKATTTTIATQAKQNKRESSGGQLSQPLVITTENNETIIVENVRDFISEAVGLAHQAVQFDHYEQNKNENQSSMMDNNNNNSSSEQHGDLEKARRLYMECAIRLDGIKPHLNAEHAANLDKFSKIYRARAMAIAQILSEQEQIIQKRQQNEQRYRLQVEASIATKKQRAQSLSPMSSSPLSPASILHGGMDHNSSSLTGSNNRTSQQYSPAVDEEKTHSSSKLKLRGSLGKKRRSNSFGSNSSQVTGGGSGSGGALGEGKEPTTHVVDNQGFIVPTFKVTFKEETLPCAPSSMNPPDWAHRPFWLMAHLHQTMTVGAYLTPGLFIPTAVWFQPGAKLLGIQAKISFCMVIASLLQDLSVVDRSNTKLLLDTLDEFIERSEREKTSLMKQLPHMHSSHGGPGIMNDKKASNSAELYSNTTTSSTGKYLSGKLFGLGKSLYKSVSDMVASQKKEETEDSQYVPWVASVLQQCQFLDKWLTEFEKVGPKAVVDRIEKISFFFYFVVCQFVMHDLSSLLDRYMKKSRESISRLFPKDHKLPV